MKTNDENFQIEIDPSIAGISRRTIRHIIREWQETGHELTAIRPNLPNADKKLLLHLIKESLKEDGGEISRQAKVIHVAMTYIQLSPRGRWRFLELLAHNFDVDLVHLDDKIHKLQAAKTEEDKVCIELQLRDALVPSRMKFLRQLITLPNGFIFLKDMRRDLLPIIRTDSRLKKLSDDIKTLLATYFDVNLLDLIEITWNSPAVMLERLMEYEAVHEIASWRELKHRLLTDHRVFAFVHYKMPNEPLIFIEVALVKGMSDNIQEIIDVKIKPGDPHKADTAIFYSISNTQRGLDGISFGNFLIKRVVQRLSSEYENLKTFATLSPIPLFRTWLNAYLQYGGEHYLKPGEEEKIAELSGCSDAASGLLELLKVRKWHENNEISLALKKPLMRLCAHYLFNVKQKKVKRAFDPVANFHLSNGAKIEHIHWMADLSKKGIAQSAGIMLNYHYRLDKIFINHENYLTDGTVHASSDARSWLG